MADVFISYHRSPGASALVRRIAGELENRGVSCWYDTQNAAPVDFVERIVTEIESSKAFVFLWDEQANEDSKKRNSYVRSEIQCAYGEKHIALFPFQVGDFEKNKTLKFYFGHINIPYGGDTPENAQTTELVNAIADTLGRTQPPPVVTQPQTLPAKIIESGKCGEQGDNVTYTLDENGVLTISGNGAMSDCRKYILGMLWDYSSPWGKRRKTISRVNIQKGVTMIADGAFAAHIGLIRVNIPDSVTSIGNSAFHDCKKLISVNIPDSVTSIGDWAFNHCVGLFNVNIPNSVTSIEGCTFRECMGLTSVDIPDTVTHIGMRAFENCAMLTNVSIPDSVTFIDGLAFAGCKKLISVSVPTKARIDNLAFPDTTCVIRR
ncbi:MAG: leucine-rich repeat protein [Oscillibacter sp.]|nr:leucine-rich repeat protein [Oscillibacter sp.]